MFHTFRWRPHEAPVASGDFGITWYELALYYALFTGTCLPIWIYHTAKKLPRPYAFDSPEAKIQPDSKKCLWHQARVVRSVVRYLENSLQCSFFPRYKKTNASSLVRLGFHRSLVGGISARPFLPHADLLMQHLQAYASLPNQSYPLNVRVVQSLIPLTHPCPNPSFGDISYDKSHNLYQKIKKCLRQKQSLHSLDVPN